MRTLFTIILCLAVTAGAFAADRTVTVTPVTGPLQSVDLAAPGGVCVYGNDNAPAFGITDWIWGQESYATVFNAAQVACACNAGFTIEQVHFFMQFAVTDVPSTFNVSVGFHETERDVTSGCNVPGALICSSPVYEVSITAAGLYDIALPMGPCACAFFGYDFAVSITFPDAFPATQRPDAVTDASPIGCISYNDYGTGFVDTSVDIGFPGELIMYADVICCEPPVPNDGSSWGDVKSLFR